MTWLNLLLAALRLRPVWRGRKAVVEEVAIAREILAARELIPAEGAVRLVPAQREAAE